MTNTVPLIEKLRPELDAIRGDLAHLREQVASGDVIGAFFIERLELALDSSAGCILLADADLAYPVAIIARSILELTMLTFWAASTPERAQEACGATIAEMTRITRKLLAEGHGKIIDKKTGEDKTSLLLDALEKQKKSPRKQIAAMARECGLGRFYERFYPLQSMPSHGHSIGLSGRLINNDDGGLYAMIAGVRAYLKATKFIVTKRIEQGEATTLAELDDFLKVGLTPPTDRR